MRSCAPAIRPVRESRIPPSLLVRFSVHLVRHRRTADSGRIVGGIGTLYQGFDQRRLRPEPLRFVPRDRLLRVTRLTGRRGLHSPYRSGSLCTPAGRAGQHNAYTRSGFASVNCMSGPATHRLAYDCRAFQPTSSYDGAHILREIRRSSVLVFAAGPPPAAMIKRDHLMSGCEVCHLLPPGERISSRAV